MDRHLDARFRACTLEDHVKSVLFTKCFQDRRCRFLCSSQRLFRRFGARTSRKTENVVGEALRLGKVEAGLVDVDGDDAGCTRGPCDGASQETNGTGTAHEDALSCFALSAS